MDHQATKRVLRLSKELCDVFEERAVDMDMVLPDYVPEVTAVLKCSLCPTVTARYRSGDRYTVSGTVTVRILYLTEDRTDVYSYEASQPFTVSFPSVQAIHHNVCVKTDYVHSRAVSSRRVDIHGAFRVYLKAVGVSEQVVYAPPEERDMHYRSKPVHYTVPFCETDKAFSVEDRLTVRAETDRIVTSDVCVLSTEIKPLVNKAIIKGILQLKTLECKNGQYDTEYYEIPFSQIVDVDGLCEERLCRVDVSVGEYELRMQSEEGGGAFCWFDGKLFASVQCFERCEDEVVLDVYSIDKPILCETSLIEFADNESEYNRMYPIRGTAECPEGLHDIVDVTAELKNITFDDTGLCACAVIGLVGRDEGGTLSYYERTIDIHEPCDEQGDVQLLKAEVVKQAQELRVLLSVSIKGMTDTLDAVTVVCDAVAEQHTVFVKNGASIRVVYAEPGDNVWDIAKKHHACAEDIMAENDLSDWTISVPTMLMIPML